MVEHMAKLFGTDGVRDIAGVKLTCEFAMRIGQAAALALTQPHGSARSKVVIGKDTRASSDMLEQAVSAGLTAMGVDVVLLGVIPTPAVAWLCAKYEADAGIVISASHNPYEHNGIKIFGKGGRKLTDAQQEAIEALLSRAFPPESRATRLAGSTTSPRRRRNMWSTWPAWRRGISPTSRWWSTPPTAPHRPRWAFWQSALPSPW